MAIILYLVSLKKKILTCPVLGTVKVGFYFPMLDL